MWYQSKLKKSKTETEPKAYTSVVDIWSPIEICVLLAIKYDANGKRKYMQGEYVEYCVEGENLCKKIQNC